MSKNQLEKDREYLEDFWERLGDEENDLLEDEDFVSLAEIAERYIPLPKGDGEW